MTSITGQRVSNRSKYNDIQNQTYYWIMSSVGKVEHCLETHVEGDSVVPFNQQAHVKNNEIRSEVSRSVCFPTHPSSSRACIVKARDPRDMLSLPTVDNRHCHLMACHACNSILGYWQFEWLLFWTVQAPMMRSRMYQQHTKRQKRQTYHMFQGSARKMNMSQSTKLAAMRGSSSYH